MTFVIDFQPILILFSISKFMKIKKIQQSKTHEISKDEAYIIISYVFSVFTFVVPFPVLLSECVCMVSNALTISKNSCLPF